MAKVKISEFDVNPDNNTDINNINIAEGCAPSGINNAIRQLMSDLKEFQTGAGGDPFNGAVNGAVNGTVGATTPATGAFTSLSASGAFSANGGATLGDASGDALTINSSAVSIPNGLNFDSNTLVIDATNNRVGVGTASPTTALDINGVFTLSGSTPDILSNTTDGSDNKRIRIYAASAAAGGRSAGIIINGNEYSGAEGDLQLNAGAGGVSDKITLWTAGNERMRITSAGYVGIGLSSPEARLHVAESDANLVATFQRTLTTTNTPSAAARFIARTSDDAADGFGSLIAFLMQDTTARENLGYIGAVRKGADSTGDLVFLPVASGTATERMRLNSSGNLGLGVTPSAWSSYFKAIQFGSSGGSISAPAGVGAQIFIAANTTPDVSGTWRYVNSSFASRYFQDSGAHKWDVVASGTAGNAITFTQAMTLDASGNLLVGKTSSSYFTAGGEIRATGQATLTASGLDPLVIHRLASDGNLVSFVQAGTVEGAISVSGTTVSYNGGHLARYAQTLTAKDKSLLKGTVLSNLDEMNTYVDADGNPVENEQLNKVKVSDVEGDANVAGVFVNWYFDEQHNVDEINMAMTGDMIIRIAQGVTVNRGDLLMSAGDGTAKPQGDDIVRGKTIAKVTSTHITCTYADGSYCVPCVLMAC